MRRLTGGSDRYLIDGFAKRGRTKPVSAAQVRAYAAKAEEYALAAASELEAGRCIAATSLAIHAAIQGTVAKPRRPERE